MEITGRPHLPEQAVSSFSDPLATVLPQLITVKLSISNKINEYIILLLLIDHISRKKHKTIGIKKRENSPSPSMTDDCCNEDES